MTSVSVSLRNVEGSSATMGWAGSHTIIVDPPNGTAGGLGLGFNGGELLALAIGSCYCNGIHYIADELGVSVGKILVEVTLELGGDPPIATEAILKASCTTIDGSNPDILIEKAKETSTVSNSLRKGFPVTLVKLA